MANASRTDLEEAAAAKHDDDVATDKQALATSGARTGKGGDFGLTEDRVRIAIQAARSSAEEARRALEALEIEALGKFGDTQKQMEQAIRDRPMQAAGIAFAAGVLATLFLRRR